MKVLLQEWMTDRGRQTSISLDKAQLDETIAALKTKDKGEPMESAMEVEIPDNHAFAGMVKNDTVFLHDDELDTIVYPDPE